MHLSHQCTIAHTYLVHILVWAMQVSLVFLVGFEYRNIRPSVIQVLDVLSPPLGYFRLKAASAGTRVSECLLFRFCCGGVAETNYIVHVQ